MITTLLALSPTLTPIDGPDYAAVTAKTCLANIRFLADDLLEGRGTPSRGLDLAASYIAAQFEALGLETAGPDGYFQVSDFTPRGANAQPAKVRNVIGVLRGSDPKLKDEFVLVTAHYDHLGKRDGEGDRIWNGANDDASGTSGVIETARALRAAKPKRTIVFMCFWGEELGLVGSRYYAKHPVFSLKQTVCNINLEQIGRTDDSEGPRVSEFNITGFDFSDLSDRIVKAAKAFGVKVTMHQKYSAPFFFASDNASLAAVGVPAHTISCAYEFPGYHQPEDEASKIDAENMAKLVRAISAGTLAVANDPKVVEWNRKLPATKLFVEAYDKLHAEK